MRKPEIIWGSVAQPGYPFGYGIIGIELGNAVGRAGAIIKQQAAEEWDLVIPVGLPSFWMTGKYKRDDLVWHTMFETFPIPKEWCRCINMSAGMWAPSNWVKDIFIESGVEVPIMVSGYGIDPKAFYPKQSEPYNGDRPFKVVAWARDFVSRKNVSMSIKAFVEANLPNSYLEVKLNQDNELKPTGVTGHNNISFIHEDWSRRDIADWLRTADLFLYPSSGEGFGMMPLEAMSVGTPTICAYNTGMMDFINDDIAYPIECKEALDPIYNRALNAKHLRSYQPSFDHFVSLIKHVYDNPIEANDKAKLAVLEIQENHTWDAVGKNALNLLINNFLKEKLQ